LYSTLYFDETAEAWIRRFSSNVAKCRNFYRGKCEGEIRRDSLDWGLEIKWGGLQLYSRLYISESMQDSLSHNNHNRKSYIDFQFMQKSMTLNDLERSKRICNGNQKVICNGRNVRLVLVLLTYLMTIL